MVETRIWQVPAPVPPSSRLPKYDLFYGHPACRLVGYDNERARAIIRHLGRAETDHRFASVEVASADFLADVAAVRRRA